MANIRFNHDYRHCKGVGCERRSVCAFRLALEEAVRLRLNHIEVIDHCNNGDMYLRVRIEEGGGK